MEMWRLWNVSVNKKYLIKTISSYLKLTFSGNLATVLIMTKRSIKTNRRGAEV